MVTADMIRTLCGCRNDINCPYCGEHCCDADYVDVGVGFVQVSAHQCECGASEIGGYVPLDKRKFLDRRERETGWFLPYGVRSLGSLPDFVVNAASSWWPL